MEKKPMSRSEAGRLGAKALNSDPEKKRIATLKGVKTRKERNPNYFREMGVLSAIAKKAKKANQLIINQEKL